jgi:hypothetical protein
MSISSWTTTPPTRHPRSRPGSPAGRIIMSTSRRLQRHGPLARSVVSRTNSRIAFLDAPSFQEGSTSLEVDVCAEADTRDVDKTGSNASVHSRARRSIAACGASPVMFGSPTVVSATFAAGVGAVNGRIYLLGILRQLSSLAMRIRHPTDVRLGKPEVPTCPSPRRLKSRPSTFFHETLLRVSLRELRFGHSAPTGRPDNATNLNKKSWLRASRKSGPFGLLEPRGWGDEVGDGIPCSNLGDAKCVGCNLCSTHHE